MRVRGMQVHDRAEEYSRSGSRLALNLGGMEVSEASGARLSSRRER